MNSILMLISTLSLAAAFQTAFHPATLIKNRSQGNKNTPTTLFENAAPPPPPFQEEKAEDPLAGMTDEQKANLFHALLRDFQIEGTPVLGCDATAVHTMSAALWNTMAEVSENNEESKICLVMEDIPQGALQAFVDDFTVLKTQGRLMAYLPELARLSVSLVGKGCGPAFVIEAPARTEKELEEKKGRSEDFDEENSTNALKSFIERVVVGEAACPYTKSVDIAAVGLEPRGVKPGPVGYRFGRSSDACATVGAFWNCVCELLATPEEEISTIMLSLPNIGAGTSKESLARFAAVMELVSRNLVLFRGDDVFGLVHFHPAYDRLEIHPVDKPAYGHLPPRAWLRPMMKMNGNDDKAESLTDEDLELSDYQRKAPHTCINILRVNQLNAASGAKSIVDLEVQDGVFEKASGISIYSRNAIRLAEVGKDKLEADLKDDIAMLQ